MDFYIYLGGIVGLFLLLFAFLLNVMRKIERNGYAYDGMNFVGAILLAVYAFFANIYLFFVLEVVWAASALFFIFERARHGRVKKVVGWDEIGEWRDLRTVTASKPKKRTVKRKKREEEPMMPWFQ